MSDKFENDAKEIAQMIVSGDYEAAKKIWQEKTKGIMAFECIVLRDKVRDIEQKLSAITEEETGIL